MKQLLSCPKEGWEDVSLQADAVLPELPWEFMKLLLEVEAAGRGRLFEPGAMVAALLQKEGWVELVPKLLGIRRWSGEELWELLERTVEGEEWGLASQVVSHAKGGWPAADKVQPVLTAAAAAGQTQMVKGLLAKAAPRGGGFTAASLEGTLRGAVEGEHWPVVQLLLEVVKAGWQAGDLKGALVAAMHPAKANNRFLKVLLSLPGIVWEGEVLQRAAAVGIFSRSWSGLEQLVCAKSVTWNAKQLQDVLGWALQHDRHELVSMVLGKGAMVFAGDAMAAAAVTAAVTSAGAQQGKMGTLELLLGRWEGWSAAVLQEGLVAAAKVGNSVVLQLLLEVPGVVWGRWALQPAVEAAAGSGKWKALRLLLGVEGVWWDAVQLVQVMVHAAAAGEVELVRELLVMVEHGWVGEEMAAAAAAAVAGKHWEVLRELLGVEGAGWVAGDLQGMLGMAVGGGIEDVGMLLGVPGVVWEVAEVAEAIEVAESQGNVKAVEQLRAAYGILEQS